MHADRYRGILAIAAVWLPPGVSLARPANGSVLIVVATAIVIAVAAQAKTVLDVTPDRRNSFPLPMSNCSGSFRSGCL